MESCAPFCIFRLSISHLLRKRINVAFASNFDSQIAFHRSKESSRRLTVASSERCSSNAETAGERYHSITIIKEISRPGAHEQL